MSIGQINNFDKRGQLPAITPDNTASPLVKRPSIIPFRTTVNKRQISEFSGKGVPILTGNQTSSISTDSISAELKELYSYQLKDLKSRILCGPKEISTADLLSSVEKEKGKHARKVVEKFLKDNNISVSGKSLVKVHFVGHISDGSYGSKTIDLIEANCKYLSLGEERIYDGIPLFLKENKFGPGKYMYYDAGTKSVKTFTKVASLGEKAGTIVGNIAIASLFVPIVFSASGTAPVVVAIGIGSTIYFGVEGALSMRDNYKHGVRSPGKYAVDAAWMALSIMHINGGAGRAALKLLTEGSKIHKAVNMTIKLSDAAGLGGGITLMGHMTSEMYHVIREICNKNVPSDEKIKMILYVGVQIGLVAVAVKGMRIYAKEKNLPPELMPSAASRTEADKILSRFNHRTYKPSSGLRNRVVSHPRRSKETPIVKTNEELKPATPRVDALGGAAIHETAVGRTAVPAAQAKTPDKKTAPEEANIAKRTGINRKPERDEYEIALHEFIGKTYDPTSLGEISSAIRNLKAKIEDFKKRGALEDSEYLEGYLASALGKETIANYRGERGNTHLSACMQNLVIDRVKNSGKAEDGVAYVNANRTVFREAGWTVNEIDEFVALLEKEGPDIKRPGVFIEADIGPSGVFPLRRDYSKVEATTVRGIYDVFENMIVLKKHGKAIEYLIKNKDRLNKLGVLDKEIAAFINTQIERLGSYIDVNVKLTENFELSQFFDFVNAANRKQKDFDLLEMKDSFVYVARNKKAMAELGVDQKLIEKALAACRIVQAETSTSTAFSEYGKERKYFKEMGVPIDEIDKVYTASRYEDARRAWSDAAERVATEKDNSLVIEHIGWQRSTFIRGGLNEEWVNGALVSEFNKRGYEIQISGDGIHVWRRLR